MSRALLCLMLVFVFAREASAQSCTIVATALAFGNYQPLSGSSSDTTATISVRCASSFLPVMVSYTILLGTGIGGSYASRTLVSTGSRLAYQVYLDPAHLHAWGDGTSGTSAVGDAYLTIAVPTTRNHTVYGTIPAAQRTAIGAYSDVLTVTVTY